MFNTNLKRSLATLGVVAGLLVITGPASAMSDPGLTQSNGALTTASVAAQPHGRDAEVEARVGGKMHLEAVSMKLFDNATEAGGDGLVAVPQHRGSTLLDDEGSVVETVKDGLSNTLIVGRYGDGRLAG